MPHHVTLIPGDGIGPEVVAAARSAVEATGVEIDWDVQPAGAAALAQTGAPLPEALLRSVRKRRVALKGPVATPAGSGFRSVNIALRDALGLRVGIRPVRSLPDASTAEPRIDVVVARMLHGDLYGGIEYAPDASGAAGLRRLVAETGGGRIPPDAGVSLKIISHGEVERAARGVLEWVRANHRARVTIVHKAPVMRATDGIFLNVARAVATREATSIAVDDRLVDAVCHDLVARPGDYDVLFTPMLYGDLLSDLCAGLGGGLGMAPGANLGEECAVFEAVHGTAPRLSGAGRANPLAMILCGAMMLRHIAEPDAATRLEDAVADVVVDGSVVTYDLKPNRETAQAASTAEVAEAVAARLAR